MATPDTREQAILDAMQVLVTVDVAPENRTARERAIFAAMRALVVRGVNNLTQRVDPSVFTQSGKPTVAALNAQAPDLDPVVTEAERDDLWDALLASVPGEIPADALVPWLPKQPMDFIRSADWNQIQVEARRAIYLARTDLLTAMQTHEFTGENLRDNSVPGLKIDSNSDLAVTNLTVSGYLEVSGKTTEVVAEIHRGNTVLGDEASDLVTIVGQMTVQQDVQFLETSLQGMILRHRNYHGLANLGEQGAVTIYVHCETAVYLPEKVTICLRSDGLQYFLRASSAEAGSNHSVALIADGTLWAWGYNANGQLGLGNTTQQLSPVQVGSDHDWSAVACGTNYTMALKRDGTLWAWGYNGNGQLGLGSTTQQLSPAQVGADADWVAVACGQNSTLALKGDGTLWAWSYNGYGQLGLGNTTQQLSPAQVGVDTDWTAVACGSIHTLALKRDGTLWSWGYNANGQLGLGNTTQQLKPIQVGSDTDWAALACGTNYTMALKRDGTLWSWGYNANGQLGLGNTTQQLNPVQVGSDADWAAAACGTNYTMARKRDGTLWSWGYNANGQLGTGNMSQQLSPVQVGSDTGWAALACGTNYTMARKRDGALWAWGYNGYGQLGPGPTVGSNVLTAEPITGASPWDYDGSPLRVFIDGTEVSSSALVQRLPATWQTPVPGAAQHPLVTEGTGLLDVTDLIVPLLDVGTNALRIEVPIGTGMLHYDILCD